MTDRLPTRRATGWSLVLAGAAAVLVGVVLLVGPGPGWLVLWLGVLTMGLGLILARAPG